MTSEEIADIEMSHFPQDSLMGLFRLCRVYIDSCLAIGEEDTVSSNFSCGGGGGGGGGAGGGGMYCILIWEGISPWDSLLFNTMCNKSYSGNNILQW